MPRTATRKITKKKPMRKTTAKRKVTRVSKQARLLNRLPIVAKATAAEKKAADDLSSARIVLRKTPASSTAMKNRRAAAVGKAIAKVGQTRKSLRVSKEKGRLVLAKQEAQKSVEQHQNRLQKSTTGLRRAYVEKLATAWDSKRTRDIEKKTDQRKRKEDRKLRGITTRINKKIAAIESDKKLRRTKRKTTATAAKKLAIKKPVGKKTKAKKTVRKTTVRKPTKKTARKPARRKTTAKRKS